MNLRSTCSAAVLLCLVLLPVSAHAQAGKAASDLPKGWKRSVRVLAPVMPPAQRRARAEALKKALEKWRQEEAARQKALRPGPTRPPPNTSSR